MRIFCAMCLYLTEGILRGLQVWELLQDWPAAAAVVVDNRAEQEEEWASCAHQPHEFVPAHSAVSPPRALPCD